MERLPGRAASCDVPPTHHGWSQACLSTAAWRIPWEVKTRPRRNLHIWVFPKIRDTPKCMVKIMEIPIKVDDLGVPLFLETPIYKLYPGIPGPPLKQWVLAKTTLTLNPKGFNPQNWVNHYFNGGGSPGCIWILLILKPRKWLKKLLNKNGGSCWMMIPSGELTVHIPRPEALLKDVVLSLGIRWFCFVVVTLWLESSKDTHLCQCCWRGNTQLLNNFGCNGWWKMHGLHPSKLT